MKSLWLLLPILFFLSPPSRSLLLSDRPAAFFAVETYPTDEAANKNQFDIELVLVRGDTFQMGCTSEQQDCEDDEKPAHPVTLSDFYIGQYEVTQQIGRASCRERVSSPV